jgi:alpha-mannosidase
MNTPVDLIGNAHIDPVWLWRWQDGFAEIKATYRAALDRINEFPDFIFTSACACYYEWVEQNAPEMFEEIKKRVSEGRFAIVGGFWIQPDCNIPSGESFCRHALYSQRYFNEKFGCVARVGYNVDSFGHNGMLPQIYRKSGMDAYVFMRPDEREKDLPASLFHWKSPDGSEVSAFRIPISYGDWTGNLDTSAFSGQHPVVIKIHATQRLQQDENLPMMCFYGVGNHGGGPTIASLRAIEAFRKQQPAAVRFASPEMYFEDAPEEGLPVVTGDLQHHASGCYAANSLVKMLNRRAENRLLSTEKLMTCAFRLLGHLYDRPMLERAWRKLLFNQFHDILAGCCIKEAYEDAIESFGESLSLAAELGNAALQKISWNVDTTGGSNPVLSKEKDWMIWEQENKGVPVIVFNPHSFEVEAPIRINKEISGVTTHDGFPVPVQRIRGSQTNTKDIYNTLFVAKLPALGYATYWIFKDREFSPALGPAFAHAEETVLENEVLRVEFSRETGDIVSIFDKVRGEQLLSAPGYAAVIDESDSDTWAHGIFEFSKEVGRFGRPVIHVLENGPLRACIRVEQHFENTVLRQDYRLLSGRAQLDVNVRMDVRLRHRQIKLCFPLAVQDGQPVYSMPYGFLAKKPDGLEEPSQQWVAVAKDGVPRIALINDGKYSFSMKDNVLRMVAVRTPAYADHYGIRDEQMEYTDQGVGEFQYALLPCPGTVDGIVRAARLMNQPPEHIVETYHRGSLPPCDSGIQISHNCVIAEVFKRGEDGDGYILRLFEASGLGAEDVTIQCVNRDVRLSFGPQEIKTVFLPDDDSKAIKECLITELD